MAVQNPRGRQARPENAEVVRVPLRKRDVSAETPVIEQAEHEPVEPNDRIESSQREPYEPDSWWSHAAFGIGAIALVVPFFIPAIPRQGLLLTYLAIGATAMIAPMVWGVIRESREAWRLRRSKRKEGLW